MVKALTVRIQFAHMAFDVALASNARHQLRGTCRAEPVDRLHYFEVERTVTYRRKVWVEVDETEERLKDERAGKSYSPYVFQDEAHDAALEKAPMLTGWEQVGVEYSAKSQPAPTKPHNVDIVT